MATSKETPNSNMTQQWKPKGKEKQQTITNCLKTSNIKENKRK